MSRHESVLATIRMLGDVAGELDFCDAADPLLVKLDKELGNLRTTCRGISNKAKD